MGGDLTGVLVGDEEVERTAVDGCVVVVDGELVQAFLVRGVHDAYAAVVVVHHLGTLLHS